MSLFVKDGRGLKLTDAGVRLRDASTEAFERLRTVCGELTQGHAEAPFVLGCSGSLLARWFIPRLGRLNADLPDLRLHLSAGEGDLDPRRPGLDALLVFAEPPWPADMQVYELTSERIGPVLSPALPGMSCCVRRRPVPCSNYPVAHHLATASLAQLGAAQSARPRGLEVRPGFRAFVLFAGGSRGWAGCGDCPAAIGGRGLEGGSPGCALGFFTNSGATGVVVAQARRGRARSAAGAVA